MKVFPKLKDPKPMIEGEVHEEVKVPWTKDDIRRWEKKLAKKK
jgi:hypothetical protein